MKNFAYIYETFFFFSLKNKKQHADKAEQQLSRFFSPARFCKNLTHQTRFKRVQWKNQGISKQLCLSKELLIHKQHLECLELPK